MRAYLLGGFLAALALAPAGTAGFQLASLAPAQRHLPPALRACTRARPGLVALRAEVPQWATTFETGNVIQTITLSESKPEVAVKVQNEENTWEPFYAALVGQGGTKNAAAMAVKLNPASGEMAPRGKEGERIRQERSDPTENYKDFALVGLELTREGKGYLEHVRGGGADDLAKNPLYLVVKTEQSSFTYQITLQA